MVGAKCYTPEITDVNFRWKMPLKIHWTIPVKIHWTCDNPVEIQLTSENPFENATENSLEQMPLRIHDDFRGVELIVVYLIYIYIYIYMYVCVYECKQFLPLGGGRLRASDAPLHAQLPPRLHRQATM